jgi:sulfite exporter TauE/SafE
LVSYIAATKEGPGRALKTYGVFSLTRIAVYALFGVAAGFFGESVFQRFSETLLPKVLYIVFGAFCVLLGSLLLFQRSAWGRRCQGALSRCAGPKDHGNAVLFGLVIACSPCAPLLAVLGFIALISDTWVKGVVYMSAFGLGTVLSPLILLAAGAGWAAGFLKKYERAAFFLKVLCGAVLLLLGARFLITGIFS